MTHRFRVLNVACIFISFATIAFGADEISPLTNGTVGIEKVELPAILVVYGENAFPVITGKSDFDWHFASVAAAKYGKGRVVAMGYDLKANQAPVTQLAKNAFAWVTSGKIRPTIASIGDSVLGVSALSDKGWVSKVSGQDVVVLTRPEFGSKSEIDALRNYVKNGGGLVVSMRAWEYLWSHPNIDSATTFQVNQLLAPMGLAFSDNQNYTYDPVGGKDRESTHALTALRSVLDYEAKKATLDDAGLKQAHGMITESFRLADPNSVFVKQLKEAVKGIEVGSITPKAPLGFKQPLKRLAVVLQAADVRKLPAEKVKADPSADTFPGKVPADAKRVSQNVTFDVDYPNWASTGLYVPAGEVATVKIPKELAGKGVVAQIGCHNSPNTICDSWERHPSIVMSWPLKSETTKIASAYGGLLYFVVPDGVRLPRQTVSIEHVVKAPRYMRGETPLYEWQTSIRYNPGPYAEFASSRITLTIPSDIARKVENPEELMQLWDRTMDLYVDLGMRKLPLKGERVVSDEQIAYGYMYAGYPIMTFLDAADFGTDVKFLTTKGSWGHWHEIGHNQQQTDWTFDGTGEVTNNLFSLYVMEKVAGQTVKDWLAKQAPNMKKHLEAGAPFEKWKSDPFLALTMYAQIEQGFGFEAYMRAFLAYRDMPEVDRPKTEDQKRDIWLVQISKACGKNLSEFFHQWGIPTSKAAQDKVKDLPTWLPEGMPKNPKA